MSATLVAPLFVCASLLVSRTFSGIAYTNRELAGIPVMPAKFGGTFAKHRDDANATVAKLERMGASRAADSGEFPERTRSERHVSPGARAQSGDVSTYPHGSRLTRRTHASGTGLSGGAPARHLAASRSRTEFMRMASVILAVDDSASMRQMVNFTLKGAGYHVVQAVDGVEALEYARQNSVDLVLTDVNMPRMDGIALVRELRGLATYRYTPMLVLTTESSQEKKMQGKQAGATGWIVKPFDPEQLLATIARVL